MDEYKKTSWSDRREYRDAIEKFLQDDTAFASFRASVIDYHLVLEHTDHEQALRCMQYVKNSRLWEHPHLLYAVHTNDSVGGPALQQYDRLGWCSPSTIRYLRILAGALEVCPNPRSIVEVGGGYGGLANLALRLTDCKRYTIYDLPEAGDLAKKYLKATGAPEFYETACACDAEPLADDYDLFISTWAFNELTIETAEQYRKLISKCAHGYVVGVWVGNGSLSIEQWREFVPGAKHSTYEPYTGFDCILTTW